MKKRHQFYWVYRRMSILVLAVCLLMGFLDITVLKAKTTIDIKDLYDMSAAVRSKDGFTTTWWSQMGHIYANGEIAFCVEPSQFINEQASYTYKDYSSAQKQRMEHIAYVGWELSDKTDEDYTATQFMIWEALGNTIESTSLSGYSKKKKEIQNQIDQLFYTFPSFKNEELILDVGKSITLTDTNGVFEYYTLESKSEGITAKKTGNKLTITASEKAPEQAKITYRLVKDGYVGTSMLYSSGTSQDVVAFKESDPRSITIDLQIKKYGALKITKQDEDGNFVAGASFKLSSNRDMSDPIATYTTGSDGTVMINDLMPATYYVQETAVPEHLVLDPSIHSITVQADQTAGFIAKNNWKQGKVLIRKIDKDSEKQTAGAVYAVYRADDDQEVTRLTTLAKGYAASEYLRFGDYYVKEVIAPNGYLLNDTKYPVTISENEQKIEITGVDERVRGTIRIEKQDHITGNTAQGEATLAGAKYGLYARENILDPADQSIIYHVGDLVSELTINDQREASISDLYLGAYYVKEIEASEGYSLDETEYDVLLSYQGQATATVTANQIVKERVNAQAFQIIKISDNDNGETDPLKGVEFTIKAQKDIDQYGSWEKAPIAKNAQGKEASVLVTDEKGYAVSDELPYGTYIVRETKVPEDHYAVPDFTVTIDEDCRDPQPWRIFNDEKFRAVIAIVKQDAETGKTVQIEGSTFKIRNLSTNEYVGYWGFNPFPAYITEWKTDVHGTVMTGTALEPGEYQIEEIKAPKGYVLNTEPVQFKVSSNMAYETLPDGSTPLITVEMSDQAVKGKLQIEKRGEVLTDFKEGQFVYEDRGLKGMTAEIIASEDILDPCNDGTILYPAGMIVDTITTDQDGKGLSKELPLGKYEIHEITAPEGYLLTDETKHVELTYEDQYTTVVLGELQCFYDERQKISVMSKKFDAETNECIAGAEFSLNANRKVYNVDGEVILEPNALIARAISDENGVAVFAVDLPFDLTPEYAADLLVDEGFGIAYGDGIRYEGNLNALWYVQETAAPKGYVNEGTVHMLFDPVYEEPSSAVQTFAFDFYNEKTKVTISKTDMSGENELAGAHLQVLDEEGTIVDEWISDGEPHLIEGLEVHHIYQLIEIQPPQGYTIMETIEFTVEDTSKEQQIVAKDEKTHVEILKVDEQGNPLAGCELAIQDENGNVIERWITGEEKKMIDGLRADTVYTLRELTPVQGYGKAMDQTFVVSSKQGETTSVVMENFPLTDIVINKIDAETKENILDEDFVFAIYRDRSCLEEIQTAHANKKEGTVQFTSLPYGTYFIKEIQAPQGYQKSQEVKEVILDAKTSQKGVPYSITYENLPLPKTVKTSAAQAHNIWVSFLLSIAAAVVLFIKKKNQNLGDQ